MTAAANNTNQIICPNCNMPFTIDESGYANILKQVHDHEFATELAKRVELIQESNESKIALVRQELQAKIDASETQKQLAVKNAITDVERERDALSNALELQKVQATSKELEIKSDKDRLLAEKDLEIARLRDYKIRNSTKGIGEDLENFCKTEFDKIRAVAFPRAEFFKDNVTVENTKGDYIFRELSEDGIEIISIMFEMKNESEETADANRQKNEKFYKKLDSDRKKKNCEYAVLVSALELDNELFNEGIVDVSHEAEKMYVVRPGFFIPIIALLRNAALSNLSHKRELAEIKAQTIDVENFKEKLDGYKKQFDRNASLATKNIADAINDIDKTIKSLQDTREHLEKSSDYIRKAYGNLDDVSITKLTARNKTMKKMFDDLDRTVDGEIDGEVAEESPLELES
jgi:hypothetical protein